MAVNAAELPRRRGRVPAKPEAKQQNQLVLKHLLDEAELMDKMVWSESPRLKLDARSELAAALAAGVEEETLGLVVSVDGKGSNWVGLKRQEVYEL